MVMQAVHEGGVLIKGRRVQTGSGHFEQIECCIHSRGIKRVVLSALAAFSGFKRFDAAS
jgi:hypothetical protein